jgi:hypothetical protein
MADTPDPKTSDGRDVALVALLLGRFAVDKTEEYEDLKEGGGRLCL